jgi:hypothetical protein
MEQIKESVINVRDTVVAFGYARVSVIESVVNEDDEMEDDLA